MHWVSQPCAWGAGLIKGVQAPVVDRENHIEGLILNARKMSLWYGLVTSLVTNCI